MNTTTIEKQKFIEAYEENIAKKDQINWQVIVMWESPLEKNYSSRTAFFSERAEADIYEKLLCDTYNKYGFNYRTYVVYIGKD